MKKQVKANSVGAVQGDVPMIRVDDLTDGGKKTDMRIVAYGESTGHHHEIRGECEVYEVERDVAGNLFRGLEVVVGSEPVELYHKSNGEHDAIQMTPGIYFIPMDEQQVAYDGENEQRVLD